MKYAIEIDNNSKAAKSLIEIAREMGKNLKGIRVFEINEQEREDMALGYLIEEGMKSGLADKKTVLKEMGIDEI
jgi:hypothetical protein